MPNKDIIDELKIFYSNGLKKPYSLWHHLFVQKLHSCHYSTAKFGNRGEVFEMQSGFKE